MTLDDSEVETSDFFNGLANRLTGMRFDVQRQVRSDPYILDLYALGPGIPRGKGGAGIVILGIGIPAATVSGASAFSSFAMRYIMENKKTLNISTFDLDVLPVIAAEGFTPEVIAWVSENRPAHKTLMDRFEFPVLVSTRTGEVWCFRKTPFNAGLHYRVLRKWATNHVGFQTQPEATS
jgi:hypothetical protein